MKQKIQLFLIAFLCLTAKNISAQNEVTVTQPKIMVIPYTQEGEDIRTVLENDVNKRIALTKIKEGFDNRGFTTVDFTAKLKAMKGNAAFEGDNKTDLKSQIVQMSGADVYVEAEIDELFSGSGNAIKIILSSYEASTGNSLSNKVGESGRFYTDDIGKLASKAVDACVEDFLNTMQAKFSEIVNNGKSIFVNVGFDENSAFNMSSEVGNQGLLLSDELEMWMEQNAFKNNYHIQGTTDNQMIFDDVRIPLKDPVNGNNYNPNKFGLSMWQFLKSLGLEVKRNIKGNTLFVTIQ